jgi:hypothetical protein
MAKSPRRRKAGAARRTLQRIAKSFRPLGKLLPSARTRKRAWRLFRATPWWLQLGSFTAVTVAVWFPVNAAYQVVRKPSELFFPVSGALYKTPAETWDAYGRAFERHSTAVVTPELLAALAQVEGEGNPVVRTYWRWSLTHEPFEIYRPASSAVGMYQITDGTFAEARRYCIHRHEVVTQGSWHDLHSCWFNSLYTRTVPSHAIELTSAYLDRGTARVAEQHAPNADLEQRRRLAAAIHLCGATGGARFARNGFDARGMRCGAHDLARYLDKVAAMRATFARLRY